MKQIAKLFAVLGGLLSLGGGLSWNVARSASSVAIAPAPRHSHAVVQLRDRSRALDREVGDRLADFWPLVELLEGFNRQFGGESADLRMVLEVISCPEPNASSMLRREGQSIQLCYALLQQLDDYFDDLSGSLAEQHLAVLDTVYLLVARELSRAVLEGAIAAELDPANLPPPSLETIDSLTVRWPSLLGLKSQTVILSGAQWLFNQGDPLLLPEQLEDWTGQPLGIETYHRLVCKSHELYGEQFPFLEDELPDKLALASCWP